MGAETDDVLCALLLRWLAICSVRKPRLGLDVPIAAVLDIPPFAAAASRPVWSDGAPRYGLAAIEIAIAAEERRLALESARERVLEAARDVADRSADAFNGDMWCDDTLALWEAVDALRDAEAGHGA